MNNSPRQIGEDQRDVEEQKVLDIITQHGEYVRIVTQAHKIGRIPTISITPSPVRPWYRTIITYFDLFDRQTWLYVNIETGEVL